MKVTKAAVYLASDGTTHTTHALALKHERQVQRTARVKALAAQRDSSVPEAFLEWIVNNADDLIGALDVRESRPRKPKAAVAG
jgi:hypothetical protein